MFGSVAHYEFEKNQIIVHVLTLLCTSHIKKTKVRGLQSASELYRQSDRCLSAKLVQTFADRGCRVVSATDPPGR
jgi:hypothetical protein